MENIAKIAIIVTLAGGLLSVGGSFFFNTEKFKPAKVDLETAQQKAVITNKNLKQAKEKLKQTEKDLEEKKTKLTEVSGQASDLETLLKTANKKVSTLEKESIELKGKTKEAEEKLLKINKLVDQKNSMVKAAQEKLSIFEKERSMVLAKLKKSKKNLKELEDTQKRRETGIMPPGISGRVVTVDKNWGFAILNVGSQNKVTEGGVFIVYRGKDYIGKIKITSVEKKHSVGDIIQEATKKDIISGDEVFN